MPHPNVFELHEIDGFTVKVWPYGNQPIAMAGALSGDGTWWPMGLAFASDDEESAIAAAVADASAADRRKRS